MSFPVLAAAAAAGIALRTDWKASVTVLDLRGDGRWRWIVGETFATGMLQPVVNGILLAALGPAGSVGYRIVATVSGGLEPIISFARTRLLVRHTALDLVISGAAALTAAGVAVALGASGVLGALFGAGWTTTLLLALATACFWRLSTLATTVPFAAMRRSGRARTVFWLRLTSTAVYFLLGVSAAFLRSVEWVFLAYAAAEVTTFVLYASVNRRISIAATRPSAAMVRDTQTGRIRAIATQE
ncbi:hypothetical protein [Amnibacterium kyonggiense]